MLAHFGIFLRSSRKETVQNHFIAMVHCLFGGFFNDIAFYILLAATAPPKLYHTKDNNLCKRSDALR